jgi:deoxyribonuclease V
LSFLNLIKKDNILVFINTIITTAIKTSNYHWAKEIQERISKKIVTDDRINGEMERICGIDVYYRNNIAHCSAVIMNDNFKLIESANTKSPIKYPYIPGLFMLRESGPILNTLRTLHNSFDVLLVDGHGILHPRKCGLASYVGFIIGKATIGVAKSLLVGSIIREDLIRYGGEVLGYMIAKEGRKEIFISVGHYISLATAVDVVKRIIKKEEWIPEPLRLADINSKYHS